MTQTIRSIRSTPVTSSNAPSMATQPPGATRRSTPSTNPSSTLIRNPSPSTARFSTIVPLPSTHPRTRFPPTTGFARSRFTTCPRCKDRNQVLSRVSSDAKPTVIAFRDGSMAVVVKRTPLTQMPHPGKAPLATTPLSQRIVHSMRPLEESFHEVVAVSPRSCMSTIVPVSSTIPANTSKTVSSAEDRRTYNADNGLGAGAYAREDCQLERKADARTTTATEHIVLVATFVIARASFGWFELLF
mmetsp:Transcript_12913/g.36374  ORF Transcript_12913/g.36374 Transcript_12913/m.36374 type:complete len:244 (-) Transcript_12913:145-876(-)